jgi:SAM-dependent methyltransferase
MNTTEYVLGASRSEQERLIRQAQTFAGEASWLLDQVGVSRGWHAADLGCGPLGLLDQLAARVGHSGRVVGVDNDPRMIARAGEMVASRGFPQVSLRLADAADTGLEPASLDLAHARLVLMHTPQPEQVIAEMAALVRSGGTVAVQDLDWVSWVCQPPHPAWDRLRAALEEFARSQGLDLFIGRRLPALLQDAGLTGISFRAFCPTYFLSQNEQHTLLVTIARQFSAALDAAGLLSADEVSQLIDELEQHLARPETMTISFLLCQAWGRSG